MVDILFISGERIRDTLALDVTLELGSWCPNPKRPKKTGGNNTLCRNEGLL